MNIDLESAPVVDHHSLPKKTQLFSTFTFPPATHLPSKRPAGGQGRWHASKRMTWCAPGTSASSWLGTSRPPLPRRSTPRRPSSPGEVFFDGSRWFTIKNGAFTGSNLEMEIHIVNINQYNIHKSNDIKYPLYIDGPKVMKNFNYHGFIWEVLFSNCRFQQCSWSMKQICRTTPSFFLWEKHVNGHWLFLCEVAQPQMLGLCKSESQPLPARRYSDTTSMVFFARRRHCRSIK